MERPKRGRGREALRRHAPHDSNRQSKQAPRGRTTVQSAYYFPPEETLTKAKNSALIRRSRWLMQDFCRPRPVRDRVHSLERRFTVTFFSPQTYHPSLLNALYSS